MTDTASAAKREPTRAVVPPDVETLADTDARTTKNRDKRGSKLVRSVVVIEYGVPRGIRTPVVAVKGRCPGPLDDGDAETLMVVELIGIEPMTSTMPL